MILLRQLEFSEQIPDILLHRQKILSCGDKVELHFVVPEEQNTTQNSGNMTRNGSSELRTGLAVQGCDSVERVVLNALANPHAACASGDWFGIVFGEADPPITTLLRPDHALKWPHEGVIKPFLTVPVKFVLRLSRERRQHCADLLGLNLKTC